MPSSASLSRPLAMAGLVAAAAGPLIIGALHVVIPPDRINPVRRTLSEYALHDTAWAFNLGVMALALGSFAVLLALVRAGMTRSWSVGAIGLGLWSLGLAAVVYFPKHNWAVGPSESGDIHRMASLIAFVNLPIAAIAIARGWLTDPRWRRQAMWTVGFAIAALLCFSVIAGAVALQPITGVRWWRAIPLGAVERALATAEVAVILSLGWWATRAGRQSSA